MTEVLIFLNIMILEIVLSIDNAAVLAAMVKELPKEQQKKALTYGIAGAYVFRGLALLFASVLIKLVWLKVAGGLYLMYLAYKALSSNVEQGGEY
jgi:predicted tellurium resistance membrane protein TerC